MADDRQWLLKHLNDQARDLQTLTAEALRDPEDSTSCARDEVFTMRETLDTLDIPHALVTMPNGTAPSAPSSLSRASL